MWIMLWQRRVFETEMFFLRVVVAFLLLAGHWSVRYRKGAAPNLPTFSAVERI